MTAIAFPKTDRVVLDIDPHDSTRIKVTSPYFLKDVIKAIPGAAWSSADTAWKFPLSWTACLALRAEFPDLLIGPALLEWASKYKADTVLPALALRECRTLSEDGAPDTQITQVAKMTGAEMKLFEHQIAGAAFMATGQNVLIADETGTGKSAQAIGAVRTLHRLGFDPFPILVVAPNTVKRTWVREWSTWWPGIDVQIVQGGVAQRRKILETPAHVYVINWESLAKHTRLAKYGNTALKRCTECGGLDARISPQVCEVHKRELNYLNFHTVIADEVHRAKSPQAKQTRALWSVGDAATWRFGLTGTPMQDTLGDLWSILRYLAPEEYPAKGKWLDRFADVSYNIYGALSINGVKDGKRVEFFNGIDPRMRRMTKKAVLPFLPPILRETRWVEMGGVQRKAYNEMVTQTMADLESGILAAESPLSRATRLVQLASSYARVERTELADGRVETTAKLCMPSNKVEAFISDIEAGDYGDSSVVVFSQSRQLIDLLAEQMTKKKIEHVMITGGVALEDRQTAIDQFQAGKVKFILVTIQAGGVGLTLTKADTMVFLMKSWSSTDMTQAESRAHRIGSEIHENVTIIDYVTQDTIEEHQGARLHGKALRIEEVMRDKTLLAKVLKGGTATE